MKNRMIAPLAIGLGIVVLTGAMSSFATNAPNNIDYVENNASVPAQSILMDSVNTSMGHMEQPLIFAQWGFWTYCQVYLTNGIQIAVVNARTVNACMSAGLRCANGRPYTNIIHNTNPFLQDADRIESCEIAF